MVRPPKDQFVDWQSFLVDSSLSQKERSFLVVNDVQQKEFS